MTRDFEHHHPWLSERRRSARIDLAEDGLPPPNTALLPYPKAMVLSPRPELFEALEAQLARHLGLASEQLLALCDASIATAIALRVLGAAGGWTLLESPTHAGFNAAVEFSGARIRRFARPHRSDFALPCAAIEERLEEEAAPILLSAPHLPSGRMLDDEELVELIALAECREVPILVQEGHLVSHRPAFRSYTSMVNVSPRVCSVGGLGAGLGLDGLRVAWLAGPVEVVAQARRTRDLLGHRVSSLDAQIALLALDRMDQLQGRARTPYLRLWPTLCAWASTRPEIRLCDPEGGFHAAILLPENVPALSFAEDLFTNDGVLVAPAELFGAKGFLRISLAIDESTMVQALAAIGRGLNRALEAGV